MKLFLTLITISLALSACQPAPPPEPTATQTPAATATASSTPSRTPRPTTDTKATQEAAQNARATEEMDFLSQYVFPDLELTGYTHDSGSLAFQMRTPVLSTALLPGYRYHEYLTSGVNPSFGDFVMGVDVTWNSDTGVAGCDILFRGDGDFGDGEFIEFSTLRLSGLPYWAFTLIKFNQVQGRLNDGYSAAINQANYGTNHYVIAAQGSNFTIYANGVRLGNGTTRESMTEGKIAFQTWQESGISTCAFENAWVWELNSEE